MTTTLSSFNFEGQAVRLRVDAESALWWVARDVCAALGLSNPRKATSSLSEDEKDVTTGDTLGGRQKMTVVNEPGLYRLIFQSRKPAAERFKRWVCHEVLPQIRRTGQFAARPLELAEPEMMTIEEFAEELNSKGVEMKSVHLVALGRRAHECCEAMGYRPAKYTGWLKLPRRIWGAALALWMVRDTGRQLSISAPVVNVSPGTEAELA